RRAPCIPWPPRGRSGGTAGRRGGRVRSEGSRRGAPPHYPPRPGVSRTRHSRPCPGVYARPATMASRPSGEERRGSPIGAPTPDRRPRSVLPSRRGTELGVYPPEQPEEPAAEDARGNSEQPQQLHPLPALKPDDHLAPRLEGVQLSIGELTIE